MSEPRIGHRAVTATHVGRVRDVNQDRSLVSDAVVAVADGMGGHAGGEKAAAIAIAELSGARGQLSPERLRALARSANMRVFEASADPALHGMGTTLVAAVVNDVDGQIFIVNVGDSRAYCQRDDRLIQITRDHSLVEDLVRDGRLSAEEALTHPQRNIVTRALGIAEEVEVDGFEAAAEIGDRFILCSDGLFNELDDATIIEILQTIADPREAVAELVGQAVEHGGRDNVTVCLIDIIEPAEVETSQSITERVADRVVDVTGEIEPVRLEGGEAEASGGGVATMVADPQPPPPTVDPVQSLDDRHRTIEQFEKPERGPIGPPKLLLAAAVVLGALIALYGTTSWYASSAWFADEADGAVVILQGRPDGVLWFDPDVVEQTEVTVEELNDASLERLRSRREWGSLSDAQEFVANLERTDDGTAGG